MKANTYAIASKMQFLSVNIVVNYMILVISEHVH